MAQACGLSRSTVNRIWHAFALQPHRTETFKLSKGPLFIEKVRDIKRKLRDELSQLEKEFGRPIIADALSDLPKPPRIVSAFAGLGGADVSEPTWERMLEHARGALDGGTLPPWAAFHEGVEL